jgi:hypothetical protein
MRNEPSENLRTGISKYGSAQNANWEESKHPRADDGKFGKGGGSAEGGDGDGEKGEPKEPMKSPLKREADAESSSEDKITEEDPVFGEAYGRIQTLEDFVRPNDKEGNAIIAELHKAMGDHSRAGIQKALQKSKAWIEKGWPTKDPDVKETMDKGAPVAVPEPGKQTAPSATAIPLNAPVTIEYKGKTVKGTMAKLPGQGGFAVIEGEDGSRYKASMKYIKPAADERVPVEEMKRLGYDTTEREKADAKAAAKQPPEKKNLLEAADAISFLMEGNVKPGDKAGNAAIAKVSELMARVEGRHEEPAKAEDVQDLKAAVLKACDAMEAQAKKDRFSGDLLKHVKSVRDQIVGTQT